MFLQFCIQVLFCKINKFKLHSMANRVVQREYHGQYNLTCLYSVQPVIELGRRLKTINVTEIINVKFVFKTV